MNLLKIAILLSEPSTGEDLGLWDSTPGTDEITITRTGKDKYQIQGILSGKKVKGRVILGPGQFPVYKTETEELDEEQYQTLLDIFDQVDPEWSNELNRRIIDYWEQNIPAPANIK